MAVVVSPASIPPSLPLPSDPGVARQWEETRRRRRMLYGEWRHDLIDRLSRMMGIKRSDLVAQHGDVDLSANTFAAVSMANAALYDESPTVTHDDVSAADVLSGIVRSAGLWPQMQRTQRDVIGMREVLVRVDALGGDSSIEVNYTPVPVDMVVMRPDRERPEFPEAVRQAVLREHPREGLMWTWDVWDMASPDGGATTPVHQVVSMQTGRDVSAAFGLPEGGLRGEAYPDRDVEGKPYLRFVLYHAARTGRLLDSFHGMEIVEGTLNVGVLWTYYGHCVRNASWPQRYTLGAVPAASSLQGAPDGQRVTVVADPTFVLGLQKDETMDGQPLIGQWSTSTNPQELAESIGIYERRLAAFAGLNPADIQRVSGDPRSGYALAITREGRREAQRRLAPVFRPADEELLSVTARMVNAQAGTQILPESGYSVDYATITLSPEERASRREHVLALLDAGLITREEARAQLGIDGSPPEEDPNAGQREQQPG